MKRVRSPKSARPWNKWMAGGDFSSLDLMRLPAGALNPAHKKFHSWISSIVTFLHATHHLRHPLQASKENSSTILKKFIVFLTAGDDWKHLLNTLKSPEPQQVSAALLVSRIYVRFEKHLLATHVPHIPSQKSDFITAIAEPFTSVVTDWTASIEDTDQKLIFELHLEGLTDEEISALLEISTEEISLLLAGLKADLKCELGEGRVGI